MILHFPSLIQHFHSSLTAYLMDGSDIKGKFTYGFLLPDVDCFMSVSCNLGTPGLIVLGIISFPDFAC